MDGRGGGDRKQNGRNSKDLRGMPEGVKSLKRNDAERKRSLIAPLKLPRFSHPFNSLPGVSSLAVLNRTSASGLNLPARMASR